MLKINKRIIINSLSFLLIISMMLTFCSSTVFAIDDDTGDKPNIVIRLLSGAMNWISKFIHGLLSGEGIGIDELVYRSGDGPFTGLTLFKRGDGQDFLALFYNVFNYIALAMFIPIMYWASVGIAKAGDSPQAKSLMKDRLNKLVLTMVYLYTMPQFLTWMVTISNGFTDIFKGIAGDYGGLVTDYIQLSEDYTFVDSGTSLVLVGINLWMISFYVIRDLTICFLFMLFPIVTIWYPFSNGMVRSWWQNMAGNVFSQPIQGLVLTIVLSIGKTLPTNNFATGIYVLIAFGSIIPMTSIIKGFLGLETGIGAGSSRAGLGGAMGAMMLARGMYSSIKGSAGQVISGIREAESVKRENSITSTELDKNLSLSSSRTTEGELNKPLLNPNVIGDISSFEGKSVAQESLARQNRIANRKMYTAVASGVGSAAFGIGSSALMGVVGTAIGAGAGGGWDSGTARTLGMAGASIGLDVGTDVGKVGGQGVGFAYDRYQGSEANKAMENEITDLQVKEVMEVSNIEGKDPIDEITARELINPQSQNYNAELANSTRMAAENKYLGIAGEKLDGSNWQAQERQALMSKKRRENTGTYSFNDYLARKDYASLTPSRKSTEELMNITDASLYQDKDRSIVYRPSEDGSYEILSVGAGNPYISEPSNNPISFQPSTNEIPNDVLFSIDSNAKSEAYKYMATAYPDIIDTTSQEYIKPFNEKVSEYKREMKHSYQDNLKGVRENLGIPNLSIQTNETKLQDLIYAEKEKSDMRELDLQQRKLAKIREENSKKTYYQYSRLSGERMSTVNMDNLF